MDMELFFILVFVVVIVSIVMGNLSGIYKRHLRFKEKELEAMATQTAEKAAQYAGKIEVMEERVRVLERIATDRGADLAHEIESLRLRDDSKTINTENMQ